MFQHLDNFPKNSAKDHLKLCELGDLLAEIQGAKENGYLTGLSFLDVSRGIGPIVDKLPSGEVVARRVTVQRRKRRAFPPLRVFLQLC